MSVFVALHLSIQSHLYEEVEISDSRVTEDLFVDLNITCRSIIVFTISDGNVFCYTRREPVGVVGAITPVFVPLFPYLWSYS